MSHTPLHQLQETAIAMIAPFTGAVVAAIRDQHNPRSKWQVTGQVFSGFVTALFLTPVIADILRLSGRGEHWTSALGFIVGLTGFSAIPVLIQSTIKIARNYLEVSSDKKD